MSKYKVQALMGGVGLLCIASPLILRLPSQFQAYHNQLEIQQLNDVERARIIQRKQTANTLAKAGILPSGQKLKIRRYLDNPNQDPQPEVTGWDLNEKVFVYDSNGVCIGYIYNRGWYWKHKYQNACNDIPVM